MLSNRPVSRHCENQRYTVVRGGRSLGSSRQATPPRSTSKIAFMISRSGHSRGRPRGFGSGIRGSRRAHSASVKSVS